MSGPHDTRRAIACTYADEAAEHIRRINHATISTTALTITDAYDIVGTLEELAARLPQTMRQIAQSLQHRALVEALVTDDGTHANDRVDAACTHLLLAEQVFRTAGLHLAAAHEAIARLATTGAPA